MRLLTLALVLMAATNATAQAATPTSYTYRILNAPTSSDERAIRTLGLQPNAQRRSDGLFAALQKVLGGTAPQLNFVPTDDPLVPGHLSTNLRSTPGAAQGTINVDPSAVEGIINDRSGIHSSMLNALPHEFAHTRQTPDVLALLSLREGAAQAFADYVIATAAQRAGIPYDGGSYNTSYSDYEKQVRKDRGLDFILGGQFGHAPVQFP